MKVLVIIVSYNFERWISRCLGSLRKSSHLVDTLVIDNGSKDQTTDIIETDYPEVRLIKAGQNLGFGRANNIGMKIALDEKYDFAFLLNQDAWISSETIGTLINTSMMHPEYGILSPVHLTGTEDALDKGFAEYTNEDNKEKCMSKKDEIISIPFVNAAFWMLPRKTLETVGGFSPLFYHYGEDIDYVNRVKYHKMKIGYVPTIWGCHDRAERPKPTGKAFFHSEFVYHLSEYANVNYPFSKAFAYGALACLKKMKKDVHYVSVWWKLMKKSIQTVKTRKINRRKHRNYI